MTELSDLLIIRTAHVSDAEALASIRVAAWRAAYRGLMPDWYLDRADLEHTEAEQLRERLPGIGGTAHVAVAAFGDQVVGYCAYGAGENADTASSGAVYDLYVHPDTWRHGVGRRLLVYAIKHFKAQGFNAATLFVFEANTRARRFYEQMGWQADGYHGIYERSAFSLPILRYRTLLSESR